MEVQLIKLNKIKVNDKNPRTITEDKLRRLIESILVFPKMLSIRPIVVDDKGVALGGNMRTRALKEIKKLGRDAIPERLQQIRQYANKPQEEKNELLAHWDAWFKDETVPVIHAESLTEEEKREFIIKDNSSFGAWDWDVLANEWESEQLDDWGVDVWQIDETETEFDGTTDSQPTEQKQAEEDDFDPDAHYETKVKAGEVWQLGEHRLMCGDSTDADAVAKLMNGEQADGVLTDPPFGNDCGYGRGKLGLRYIENDDNTKVLSSFFAPLDSVLKNNTHCLIWVQWRTFSTLEKAFEKYKLRTVVIWDKMQLGLSGGGFAEQYEMMCVFIKGHATQNEYCGNVWQISREHDKRSESEHPHKKPIALLGKALNLCSHDGDIILDLFGGSGSTMIACEQLGRKCRMMELDPHYCDVIIARWEMLTGEQAVKIG